MTCLDFQNLLQRCLDGENGLDVVAAERHLAECAECRGWQAAAERLQQELHRSRLPLPPESLVERIVARAIQERRQQIVYRRLTVAAVAASLLVVAILGYQWGWVGGVFLSPKNPEVAQPEPRPGPAPSLRANVDDAVGAITGLVNQTAGITLEPGRILFPDRAAVAFLAETAALQPPMTSVPSLREASQGVTEFAPVMSFGRFINYFAQDIPGIERDRKSRS